MSIKQEIEKYLDKISETKTPIKSTNPELATPELGVYSLNERWFQDLYKFGKKSLFQEHVKCHEALMKCKEGSKLHTYLVKAHEEIVREMKKRGIKHYIKTDLDKEAEKKLATNTKDRIYLKEIINKFQNFNRNEIIIWLIGDSAKNGFTDKNIDLLVTQKYKDRFVEKKIVDMFPKELRRKIRFHYVPEGPSTDCIPIYVVKFEMPNDNILEMITLVKPFDFVRPLNASAVKDIKRNKIADVVQKFPIEITELNEDRIQIHKHNDKIKIYNDGGEDITAKIDLTDLKKQDSSFIVDAFIDEKALKVFDCLWFNNRDLHGLSLTRRTDMLDKIKFTGNFVQAKAIIAADKAVLTNAVAQAFTSAKQVLIRPLWEDYSLKGVSNKWILLKIKEDK